MLDTFYVQLLSEEEEDIIGRVFFQCHEATYYQHRLDLKAFGKLYKRVLRASKKGNTPSLNVKGKESLYNFMDVFKAKLNEQTNLNDYAKLVMECQINEMRQVLK